MWISDNACLFVGVVGFGYLNDNGAIDVFIVSFLSSVELYMITINICNLNNVYWRRQKLA